MRYRMKVYDVVSDIWLLQQRRWFWWKTIGVDSYLTVLNKLVDLTNVDLMGLNSRAHPNLPSADER